MSVLDRRLVVCPTRLEPTVRQSANSVGCLIALEAQGIHLSLSSELLLMLSELLSALALAEESVAKQAGAEEVVEPKADRSGAEPSACSERC